jgi:hypothetical protein
VVSSLGDPRTEPIEVLANRRSPTPAGHVTLADLDALRG